MLKIPNFPNVTLVAFYDKSNEQLKSDRFIKLIENITEWINIELSKYKLNDIFEPYPTNQVHATILGCEGAIFNSSIINKWFYEKRQKECNIDFKNLIQYFRYHSNLPIAIRFCGYNPDTNFGFLSQNRHPFERSFQIREDDTKAAMLMGWPYNAGQWPLHLYNFRIGAQTFNILHKYHKSLSDVDNDCYLRIGCFKELPDKKIKRAIENSIRNKLTSMNPIYESINHNNLRIVKYNETTLDLKSTEVLTLDEISEEKLMALYPDPNP